MANFKKVGFGQVEPNHLSAQRTSQIYAQLPAAEEIEVLENGQYVKYDYAENKVDFTGAGEWMMVFNEVKLYDDMWRESYKDFAMKKKNAVDGIIVPRVIKTNVGDIYTTNAITDNIVANVSAKLTPDTSTGLLKVAEGNEDMLWQVVAVTTMPDGSDARKLMRIK